MQKLKCVLYGDGQYIAQSQARLTFVAISVSLLSFYLGQNKQIWPKTGLVIAFMRSLNKITLNN